MNIKITFAKRQTPGSRFSHFEGTDEQLITLIEEHFDNARQGYREGVLLVPVPAEGFFSGVVKLSEGDSLQGIFDSRRPTEEPRKSVGVLNRNKLAAKKVDIVLYSRETMEEEEGYVAVADWEVISINASPTEEETPMLPETLMANHFEISGGTSTKYSPEEFESALRKSFLYWRDKAMCL